MSLASKIIIANWKANPNTLEEAQNLFAKEASEASRHPGVKTVICPPFVFLEELFKLRQSNFSASGVALGVQDLWEAGGPFTGEISPEMVRNLGAHYALIGHSDRRYTFGETDDLINRKVVATLKADITPVLLIGEKERVDYREDVLVDQLLRDLAGLNSGMVVKILFVYEPVWAISTTAGGHSDTPANAVQAVEAIRNILSKNWQLDPKTIKVLYGGSVNEHNALQFLERPEIGGAVVGGASLDAEKFGHILKLASNL